MGKHRSEVHRNLSIYILLSFFLFLFSLFLSLSHSFFLSFSLFFILFLSFFFFHFLSCSLPIFFFFLSPSFSLSPFLTLTDQELICLEWLSVYILFFSQHHNHLIYKTCVMHVLSVGSGCSHVQFFTLWPFLWLGFEVLWDYRIIDQF